MIRKICQAYCLKDQLLLITLNRDLDWIWFYSNPYFFINKNDKQLIKEKLLECLKESSLDIEMTDKNKFNLSNIGVKNYPTLYKKSSSIFSISFEDNKYELSPYTLRKNALFVVTDLVKTSSDINEIILWILNENET
jgi:hypothetical protein